MAAGAYSNNPQSNPDESPSANMEQQAGGGKAQSEGKYQVSYKWQSPKYSDFLPPSNPEERYKFTPVSETDPWFTADMIETKYTHGGELYIKREDGSEPTSVSETYVGPYFTWKEEPQYSNSRKLKYGVKGDNVIGKSYYGRKGHGKPKNQGLRPNLLLAATSTRIRDLITDVLFDELAGFGKGIPDITPSVADNPTTINVASQKEVYLDKIAERIPSKPDVIKIKQHDDKKYVHIPMVVSVTPAVNTLRDADSDLSELASAELRHGIKGTAPVITNQPAMEISIKDTNLGS